MPETISTPMMDAATFSQPRLGFSPEICDAENLRAVSLVLKKVELFNGDYGELTTYCKKGAFVYLDPPYSC